MAPVTLSEIQDAANRLAGVAYRTPLLPAMTFQVPGDNQLWLKAENLQRTGSFKFRGAYNAVSGLSPEERARGVITYSSGNHGQAVAAAAALVGIPAVIVVPENAVPIKVEAIRRWGAEIVCAGTTSLDRENRAHELVAERGYVVIPPFDDRRIIAGQGTAGLEIAADLPEVDAVVVQVGGGGLMSGVATAVKALKPSTRIIGVEPAGAADAKGSLTQDRLVTWDRIDTVADGLRTSRIGELNFATMRELVDDIVTVEEDEILAAVGELARETKLVVEPSGAVATAALLNDRTGLRGARVVALISVGNVDPHLLAQCVAPAAAIA